MLSTRTWSGMDREAVIAVTNGRLDGFALRSTELTPRAHQNLWHVGADLVCPDGRRRKRVLVKTVGE